MTYWKPVWQENWRGYGTGPMPVVLTKNNPWIAANQPNMYTKIVSRGGVLRALSCGGTPVPGQDDGARLFRVGPDGRWTTMSAYENQLIRVRCLVNYPKPFTIAQGEGNYCQVLIDGKTNTRPNAEIQFGLETINGQNYHWVRGVNSEQDSRDANGEYQAPIKFGVDLEYTIRIYLSRFSDGWFELDYGGITLRGEGPNMDADLGYFGPAFCGYTNALESGSFEVQYSSLVLEVAA